MKEHVLCPRGRNRGRKWRCAAVVKVYWGARVVRTVVKKNIYETSVLLRTAKIIPSAGYNPAVLEFLVRAGGGGGWRLGGRIAGAFVYSVPEVPVSVYSKFGPALDSDTGLSLDLDAGSALDFNPSSVLVSGPDFSAAFDYDFDSAPDSDLTRVVGAFMTRLLEHQSVDYHRACFKRIHIQRQLLLGGCIQRAMVAYKVESIVLASEDTGFAPCHWRIDQLRLGVTLKSVTLGNVTMSHRTRERPAECLASLSHSTMIGRAQH
ncbi:hypothetical protein EVAR_88611_1 [Eumeta japonica]|uniref:Uncharacterized protein n=1 Tax=Eumeta variegata TaxID=151549 RepID=A0A4C1X1Y5_EUMVA|nr:hypothetical protein EVAR_88611_1 [Eumeta japonica]